VTPRCAAMRSAHKQPNASAGLLPSPACEFNECRLAQERVGTGRPESGQSQPRRNSKLPAKQLSAHPARSEVWRGSRCRLSVNRRHTAGLCPTPRPSLGDGARGPRGDPCAVPLSPLGAAVEGSPCRMLYHIT
jgi:hypothetical protein